MQAENYQLRDYIINLQSRLIESQGDFPPAPSNINLQQPMPGAPGVSQDGDGQAPGSSGGPNGEASLPGAPTAPMAGAALSMMQQGPAQSQDAKTERKDLDPALTRA